MGEKQNGRLHYPGEIRKYVLGGNATFTLRDQRGAWITWKVKSAKANSDANWSTQNQDRSLYFVSALTGSDNESSYTYVGLLKQTEFDGYEFKLTRKSPDPATIYPRKFREFWQLLEEGCQVHPRVEFWHEGACGMCGRKLTVPESIASGIGPECATKGGM